MLALNGTVVPAFDEAITILCISPLLLGHFSLHRNFLTLLMLKYPAIHIRSLRQKQCEMDGATPGQTSAFLYATPQNLGAWRGHFPKSLDVITPERYKQVTRSDVYYVCAMGLPLHRKECRFSQVCRSCSWDYRRKYRSQD
jgi:hypothetical protein